MQLRELREYAELRGLVVISEYIDKMSGSKASRPAFNQLMADASQRKFDAVLVWKLDRFGRSLRHMVNALAELEALGLSFISLRDNLDLTTPSGRLMFHHREHGGVRARTNTGEGEGGPSERESQRAASWASTRGSG